MRRCEYDDCIAPATHEIIVDGVTGDVREGLSCCDSHFSLLEAALKKASGRYHKLLDGGVHPRVAERILMDGR